ncbi:conserved hypothetical protein [Methylobacterium sp. 4-46]|uniref:hypothetical protein n=1 Tax=unclassified Methylobacterium TaxID=2615210 RepID=UPI000165C7C9|nr:MULTISPECIES: hypothetical protein [Methylobacterium]ACA15646.1 conserved hypothetical protein [Methylobacterium sp. 4-46]WFT81358.1 hypothetical protein QA634_05555 [Methylobacterium nodulans]
MGPRGLLRRPILLAALPLIASCVQQGDLGRPAPTAWNSLVDAAGALAARDRGAPASPFPFTEDEKVLRDRAWRYLMPARDPFAFEAALADLTRARLLPAEWRPAAPSAYFDALMAEEARSPVSRYRRLSDDAAADGRLLPAFAETASRVMRADLTRLRSLPFIRTLNDADVRSAALRVAENRCLVAWVRREARLREEGYRYALEHLLVAVPDEEAVGAERVLAFLAARRRLLDPLLPVDAEARCGLAPGEGTEAVLVTKG